MWPGASLSDSPSVCAYALACVHARAETDRLAIDFQFPTFDPSLFIFSQQLVQSVNPSHRSLLFVLRGRLY